MISFLVWAAIFQGIFLAFLYLSSKAHNSLSNKVLGLFLLALVEEAVILFIPAESIGSYSLLHYFGLPEVKLFLPTLFLHYVMLKLGLQAKYIKVIRIIYALGFIVLSLTLVNILLYLITGKQYPDIFTASFIEIVYMFQQSLACFLSIVFLGISVMELRGYQINSQSLYSDLSLSHIKWLWRIIYCMTAATTLWTLELIRIAFGGLGTGNVVYISWGILFLFIYYASYTAFVQRDLFAVGSEISENSLAPISIENKETQETTHDSGIDLLSNSNLDKLMKAEELYLDPDLDIYKLSKIAGISSRNITKSIKSTECSNFSEWVNKYRVDYAIQLLEKISKNQLTIEGIGYNSGFNSRSAMYMAFKKIEGHTPGFFKK